MDMLLEKNYYTIEEALLRIKSVITNFNENDLLYYGENEKLKLNLYVGSRLAYAAEYTPQTEQVFFIGHCRLHGLFSLTKSELCSILTNDKHLIPSLAGYPHADFLEISNWSTDIPEDAKKAKLGYETVWMPQEYTPKLKHTIQFFYLRPRLMLQMIEGAPGVTQFINAIPENILADAIKFDLAKIIQWPESQIFCKNDLRVTHENLHTFINYLKPATSSSNEKKSVLEIGTPEWRQNTARTAANARHSQKGGSRDKQSQIKEIWARGKYTSRDRCAEKECAGLNMSFTAARKALRNTPDPT